MYDFEYQWQQILNDNIFTEEAILTKGDDSWTIKGCYYSGSYEEDSPAPYAPKALVEKDGFQVSALELPSEMGNPMYDLNGCTLHLTGRDLDFRVLSVMGNHGGMYTMRLQPVKEDEEEEEEVEVG